MNKIKKVTQQQKMEGGTTESRQPSRNPSDHLEVWRTLSAAFTWLHLSRGSGGEYAELNSLGAAANEKVVIVFPIVTLTSWLSICLSLLNYRT